MKLDLEIKTINFIEEEAEGYRMIAFGDSENESEIENFLILQKAISFNEQDVKLGMDTYYIEFNNQSGYGICDTISLQDNIITFIFPQKKNSDLTQLKLKLVMPELDIESLKSKLKLVLGESISILS